MFAYVKYGAKCPRHDEKKMVPVSIIRNFDSKNIGNRNKSYNVKCGESYCPAIIIFTDESEKALKAKIAAKRSALPPKNLIEPASDLDIPNMSGAKQQAAREKRGEQVKKLLSQKIDTLRNKAPQKRPVDYPAAERSTKTMMENVSYKRTVDILQDRTNVAEERHAVKQKNPALSSNKEGRFDINSNMKTSAGKPIVGSAPKKAKPNSYDKGDTEKSRVVDPGKTFTSAKIVKKNTSGVTLKTAAKSTEISDAIGLEKSSTLNITHGNNSGRTPKPTMHLKIQQQCSFMGNCMTEQKNMIKELTQLNMELQREIIDYFEDFKAMAKQYEGAVRNLEGASKPPVGYIQKSTNTIHLGHNTWISKKVYDNTASSAKTPKQFVKGMAVAVFGFAVLEASSVTGAKSNKFPDRPAKPKLDGAKILAIHDIFEYWLRTAQNLTAYDAHVEASKTRLYISRKISDMNRPPAGNKKGSSATAVTDEVDDPIGSDNDVDHPEELHEEANTPEKLSDEADISNETDNEADGLEEESDLDNDPAEQVDREADDRTKLDQKVDKKPEAEQSVLRKDTLGTEQPLFDAESAAESEPDEAKEAHRNVDDLV